MTSKPNPHLKFAERYAQQLRPTLSVDAALARASHLMAEIESLKQPSEAMREIYAYYLVGFVTCLEWHARSRIVDLFTFKPTAVTEADFKLIGATALGQLIQSNVSVAYLLGSIQSVSTPEQYIRAFNRMYNELSIKADAGAIVHQVREIGPREDHYPPCTLVSLYEVRNHLVHEIDLSIIGRDGAKDYLSLERAYDFGALTVRLIRAIEAEITKHAPRHFPNKFQPDGSRIDELEFINEEIVKLEDAITADLSKFIDEEATEAWIKSVEVARKHDAFLDAHFLIPVRYVNRRRKLEFMLKRQRLTYLQTVWEQMVDVRAYIENAPNQDG